MVTGPQGAPRQNESNQPEVSHQLKWPILSKAWRENRNHWRKKRLLNHRLCVWIGKLLLWVQREINSFCLVFQSGSWRRYYPFSVLAAVDAGYSNFKRQNEDSKLKVYFKGKSTLTFWQMHLPLPVCSGMNHIIRVKRNLLPKPRSIVYDIPKVSLYIMYLAW